MKHSRKVVGLLLLSLVMGMMAVASVSAATKQVKDNQKSPTVDDDIYIWLFKESDDHDDALPWLVSKATSVIPVKNLKWNAALASYDINKPKKVHVCCKKVGTYYLNFEATKYIKPGDEVEVSFAVNQNNKMWYNLTTTLHFVERPTPFRVFTIGGVAVEQGNKNFGRYNQLNGDKNIKDAIGKNLKAALYESSQRIVVRMFSGYKLKKIVITDKCGFPRTIANGNKINLKKIQKIQVKYEVTTGATVGALLPYTYYKKEAAGYSHLYDVTEIATLKF
jgi:hypothetical protein